MGSVTLGNPISDRRIRLDRCQSCGGSVRLPFVFHAAFFVPTPVDRDRVDRGVVVLGGRADGRTCGLNSTRWRFPHPGGIDDPEKRVLHLSR